MKSRPYINKRAHPLSEQRFRQAHPVREETATEDAGKGQILPGGTLLKRPTAAAPPGCNCGDVCMAPKVMGRQLRCRREKWEGPAYEYGVTGGSETERTEGIAAAIVAELDRQGCAYGGIDIEKLATALAAPEEQMVPSRGEELVDILRERASYLRAMVPEGLSTIARQSMAAMESAANELVRLDDAIRTATVSLARPECEILVPGLLLFVSRGGTVNEFAARQQEQNK